MKNKKHITSEKRKWQDPIFWTGISAALLPLINRLFELGLEVELINTHLGALIGLFFKKRQKKV